MSEIVWIATVVYALIFLVTAVCMTFIGNFPTHGFSQKIMPLRDPFYAWFLACWMILGMIANYSWDLFRAGKGFADFNLPNLLLPILVSPIVFYAVWSLVPKDSSGVAQVNLTWPLVAFQNGFFWQVIFSKSTPII